jgi:MerR family transcriptional regulator, light-induced transcriptional regulator
MPSLNVNENMPLRASGRLATGRELATIAERGPEDDAPSQDETGKRDCVDLLTRMVEGEIIPRLLLAHQAEALPPPTARPAPTFGPGMTDLFAQKVLSSEVDALLEFVVSLMGHGVSVQAIYLDLLAPTARRLGDYWNEDICSFSDVTIGLGRLQQILHELGRRSTRTHELQRRGQAILLVTAPSEQHTFGLLIIEEFFRRAGWRTWCEPGGSAEEVAQLVSAQWYDVIGLSVSCDSHLDQVSAIVTSVRRSSKNPAIRVMIGGQLLIANPELALSLGADVTAFDGADAVAIAEGAVTQLEGRC